MRDDKRYFLVKINLNNIYPKLSLVRVRKDDGSVYYGPFPHGSVLKKTVDFLSGYFKIRLCMAYEPNEDDRKHCMDANVKKCSEPCAGKVTRDEYLEQVTKLVEVLDGNIKEVVTKLEEDMHKFAEKARFERAAERRDMITNIRDIFGKRNRNFRYANIPSLSDMDAVEDLQKILGLKNKPSVIECFDISNLGEEIAVASMVCFTDGKPDKKKYRRFKIKTVEGQDDFAMMNEVINRHYSRKLEDNKEMPGLLMVDGGKGQLSSALKALVEVGTSAFPVVGLAKKREEIFLPGRSEPVIVDRTSPALRLLQAVRDEAHRFAVTYNREIRLKRISQSILDDIPGIGTERKTAILKAFSSINDLKKSTPEEIVKKADNIGIKTATYILEYLSDKSD